MANRLFRTAVLATIGLGATACAGADQESDREADREPTQEAAQGANQEARRSESGGDEVFANQLGEGSPKIRRDADGAAGPARGGQRRVQGEAGGGRLVTA